MRDFAALSACFSSASHAIELFFRFDTLTFAVVGDAQCVVDRRDQRIVRLLHRGDVDDAALDLRAYLPASRCAACRRSRSAARSSGRSPASAYRRLPRTARSSRPSRVAGATTESCWPSSSRSSPTSDLSFSCTRRIDGRLCIVTWRVSFRSCTRRSRSSRFARRSRSACAFNTSALASASFCSAGSLSVSRRRSHSSPAAM